MESTQEAQMNFAELFENARTAAQAESDASEARQTSWYPCGFAWIVIRPARGPFITWCKKNGIGSNAYGGGWPSSSSRRGLTPWAALREGSGRGCEGGRERNQQRGRA